MMPGNEMDTFIAEKIMGSKVLPFSTDLNAAWIVWQRLNKSHMLSICDSQGQTEILRWFDSKWPEVIAGAQTGAHAICLAAEVLLTG